MTKLQRILVVEIALGERSRRVDPAWAEDLAKKIKASGGREPQLKDMIEVRPIKRAGTPYEVVTGAHRLKAVKLLGWREIEARILHLNAVEAKTREISDYFSHKNLTVLAKGRSFSQLKKIYLEWYPQTARGGARRGEDFKGTSCPFEKSFSKKTAEDWGLDRRTIDRYIAVFESLLPEVVEDIEASGHKIADNQSELTQLGSIEKEYQSTVFGRILDPTNPAQTVAEALAWPDAPPKSPPEYGHQRWWDRMDDNAQDRFFIDQIASGRLERFGIPADYLDEPERKRA